MASKADETEEEALRGLRTKPLVVLGLIVYCVAIFLGLWFAGSFVWDKISSTSFFH